MQILANYFKYQFKQINLTISKIWFSSLVKPPWKILFFGTDDFSVSSLKYLNNEFKHGKLINTLEVVTSTKANQNPVRIYAKNEDLSVHSWPVTLVDNVYDLGIVVSFGHLIPDHVINKFPLGIINVHASLLPRWRGAAPIIHAIANGDTITGVTIMKIQPNKFDIGEIVTQKEIRLPENIQMPDLYMQLADLGASVLISTLKDVPNCLYNATPQPKTGITYAPKVTPNMAKISWNTMTATQVYALARALYGLYPLTATWNNTPVKLYNVELCLNDNKNSKFSVPGTVEYNKNINKLLIKCLNETWISCSEIGVLGKKPMRASDFNNGYLKKELIEKRVFH